MTGVEERILASLRAAPSTARGLAEDLRVPLPYVRQALAELCPPDGSGPVKAIAGDHFALSDPM